MTALVLVAAAVLGVLGFYEPCTVATHTLYAVRASREPRVLRDSLLLAVPRAVALAALVAAAAAVGPRATLPLVVALLAALAGDPRLGALAGAIFGVALSAPTIWYSLRGVPPASRAFLGRAAHASHYVTTALLWGGAGVAWLATG